MSDGQRLTAFDQYRHVPRLLLVGTVLTLPGAVSAELVAEAFDVVWIDLEHGALGRGEAQEMMLGAQAAGALAFVRLGITDAEGLVGAMLDAGADGIVAADVRDVAQADWLTSLMHHPPKGRRGYGPRRAALRGRRGPAPLESPELWLQVESQEGVAAAVELALTPGVDALVIGVADLCFNLGIQIGLTDSRLRDAIRAVHSAAEQAEVRFGLAGPLQPADALGSLLQDVNVLVHSTDARLCAAAVDQAAQSLRFAQPASRSLSGGADG
jgi:4-hydroxy-2-oxoheptanedioate aldolase